MALIDSVSGHIIDKGVVDPAFKWFGNAKDMENNIESLYVTRNRLEAAIGAVKRKVDAAEAMPKRKRRALRVPETVVRWQVRAKKLEKKVADILRKADRVYPQGDATASAPANAWTKCRLKLSYANRVIKYDEVVTKFLDKSEASTKATMGQLLQAPKGKSSLGKEMKELERLRDDIHNIHNGVKYRVDWPLDKRAWRKGFKVMRAEVKKTKKEYSNMVGSPKITPDWLVSFNEETGELRTKVAALKSRGVELKAKAEELVACLNNVETKMEELSNAMTVVLAGQKTIQDKVAVARSNLLVPRDDVLRWLEGVGQAKGEFDKVDAKWQELAKSGGSTLARWRELGKEVTENKGRLDRLVAQSSAFDHQNAVVDPARRPLSVRESTLETNIVIGQEKYLEMAREAIEAADVGIIGIYGDGGVGKSTLLSTIHDYYSYRIKGFDVVMNIDTKKMGVPWSSDSTLIEEKIQEAMILKLLPPSTEINHRKREKIRNALQGTKFLILIDNIWGTLDLGNIGVLRKSAAAGSTVIFTTRFENVVDGMQADRRIRVTSLDGEEARKLFKQTIGEGTLKLHNEIPHLAKQLADKCEGLPLALKLIGAEMRKQGCHIEGWKHGLRTLSRTNGPEILFEGVDELYSCLALSYDLLPTETHKQCFLYCALFPDNSLIPSKRDLVNLWMGEKFFDHCMSVEEARNEGSCIIKYLQRVCLVEVEKNNYNEECITMHNMVRGMARWVVSRDKEGRGKFFIDASATPTGQELDSSSGLGFVGLDAEDWPEDVQRVYVGGSRTQGFTELKLGSKNCNKLSTLIFQRSKLERFEDGCFALMPNLRVFNLSRVGIVDLRIGEEKELGQLRVLRLWHTDQLRQLPEEGLAKVKILLVNNPGWKGNSQIRGVIKRLLSQLWVLSMYDPTLENMQLKIADLENAPRLQELSIAIKTQSNLEALVRSSRLAKCVVRLSVRDCEDTAGVFNLLGEVGTLNKLRVLKIKRCPSLKQIKVTVDTKIEVDTNSPILQSLEQLYISRNERLRQVQVGHRLPSCALQKLRALVIDSCSSFTILDLGSLVHTLEYLEISTCTALVEILRIGHERDSLKFKKLRVILLHDLPKLTAICKDGCFSFQSLKKLEVNFCPKLNHLPKAIKPSILAGQHSIVDV